MIWLYILGALINAGLAFNSWQIGEVNRLAITMVGLFLICGIARTIVGRGE